MQKTLPYFAFALFIALSFGSISAVANAKRTAVAKVPVRVHFSGNLEGEIEPCG